MENFSRKTKIGFLVGFLAALAAGQSAFAYPQVQRGYAFVEVFYDASGTHIVGRIVRVSGCTAGYPQPLTQVGSTSSNSQFGIYACGQVPGPDAPPPIE